MYKLLLIDDDDDVREGLCNFFPWHEVGFEVCGMARNGAEGLSLARTIDVDVVLSDIRMPGMTGIDMAKELYLQKSKVKIIFLSGYKDFEYAQKAINYGVKNYIVKPTKFEELIKVFIQIKEELELENEPGVNGTEVLPGLKNDENKNLIIETIKDYVQEHYQHATLECAAKLVHMNLHYICKLFKKSTGQNFSDYVIAVKMEKASELLKDITYKTYEVSDMVGYTNPRNFTRTFKSYFGIGPKEYRNSF